VLEGVDSEAIVQGLRAAGRFMPNRDAQKCR